MKTMKYVIQDELGIHARPAGMLVKEAKKFSYKITISGNGKSADLTKLLSLMSLGIKHGTEVEITAEGDDEDAAIEAVGSFLKENL